MLMVVPLEIKMSFGVVKVKRNDISWWQHGSMIWRKRTYGQL